MSGLAFALLINAVTNDGEIKTLAFVIFAIGAVIAAVAAIVLWSKTLRK